MNRKTIKKYWLAASIVDLAFPVIAVLLCFIWLKNQEAALSEQLITLIALAFTQVISGCLVSFLFFLILLRCAYKKPGTRFLSFTLFWKCLSTAIVLCVSGLLYTVKGPQASLGAHILIVKSIVALSIACRLTWCYIAFLLRRANKKERLAQALPSPL